MYNPDTEVLFPMRVSSQLKTIRGKEWLELIDKINDSETEFRDQMAFSWMMVQLCSCVSCNADSFRAMRGCTQCAAQTIRRYHGDDHELFKEFEAARRDVEKFITVRINGNHGQ
jgi:hypothetical protein